MTSNITGSRGALVSPRVALLSILCFWTLYYAIATLRWLMLDYGHQVEMMAARALVTIGSMLATFFVYLAMRPLASRSLTANVTAVALLSVPAAIAYSSMNWAAFHQMDKQLEAEKTKAMDEGKIVVDSRVSEATRERVQATIEQAREAIRQASQQAREAAQARREAEKAKQDARDEARRIKDEARREAAEAEAEARRDAAEAKRDAAQARREALQTQRELRQQAAEARRDAERAQREDYEAYKEGMRQAREAVQEARRYGINLDLDKMLAGVPVPPAPPPVRAAPPAVPTDPVPPEIAPVAPVAPAASTSAPSPKAAPDPVSEPIVTVRIPTLSPDTATIQVGPTPSSNDDMEHKTEYSPIGAIADQAMNGYFFFAAWGALFLALSYAAAVRLAEREAATYRAAARDAEIRALRYQVNPHFLFNTLNSLSTLVLKDQPDEAEKMILNLSTFFRTSLTADPGEDVTLAEEIKLQRLYLDIEAIRFPERLSVEIDIPQTLRNACVPCLILQPLVENAIKYGVSRSKRPVTVFISAREDTNGLVLSVEDDGEPIEDNGASKGTGVGLRNVTDRLKARFGEDAACRSGRLPNGGFGVTLFMPLVRHGA